MHRKRPPLNPIRSFEAAARHRSFTEAAKELGVTQVAVSRQVRALEDYLGVALFVRDHRTITLTEHGAKLFPPVNRAFDEIFRALPTIGARNRQGALSIQSYTTFGQRWLVPRLSRFHERFKSIELRLTASVHPVDFDRQDIHAAIRTGKGRISGCTCDFLLPIELVPVCSPRLLESLNRSNSADLLGRHVLLHSLARPDDWAAWLAAAGVAGVDPRSGLKFENSVLAYEAALQGIGLAMGVRVLVEPYLRLGSLVAPFGPGLRLDSGYYLVRPEGRPMSPALRHFRAWLLEEATAARKT